MILRKFGWWLSNYLPKYRWTCFTRISSECFRKQYSNIPKRYTQTRISSFSIPRLLLPIVVPQSTDNIKTDGAFSQYYFRKRKKRPRYLKSGCPRIGEISIDQNPLFMNYTRHWLFWFLWRGYTLVLAQNSRLYDFLAVYSL